MKGKAGVGPEVNYQPPPIYRLSVGTLEYPKCCKWLSALSSFGLLLYAPIDIRNIMPPSLVNSYERLLLHNISTVATVESGIRNITWLLPGRFQDAEVASEGCEWCLSTIQQSKSYLIMSDMIPQCMPY